MRPPKWGVWSGGYFTGGATVRGGKVVGGTGAFKYVTGAAETIAVIESIESECRRQLAQATLAGALVIDTEAKRIVPVKTGNLKRSIHPELTHAGQDSCIVEVGTDVEYAPWVEMGTTRMVGRPFLRPALHHKEAQARLAIIRAFKQIVKAKGGRV